MLSSVAFLSLCLSSSCAICAVKICYVTQCGNCYRWMICSERQRRRRRCGRGTRASSAADEWRRDGRGESVVGDALYGVVCTSEGPEGYGSSVGVTRLTGALAVM